MSCECRITAQFMISGRTALTLRTEYAIQGTAPPIESVAYMQFIYSYSGLNEYVYVQ
jgi:hypothetical protein